MALTNTVSVRLKFRFFQSGILTLSGDEGAFSHRYWHGAAELDWVVVNGERFSRKVLGI
jgi:hypothetical protein